MTVGGWIIFVFMAIVVAVPAIGAVVCFEDVRIKIGSGVLAVILILALLFGMRWLFQNTAIGQRALTDQKSNFSNGLERTVTVYTADGEIIAQYSGKIDIKGNNGGCVIFDFEGKRYGYYNCFVEAIAEIG